MRKTAHFTINEIAFKEKMLSWASRFSIFCFLDNCNYDDPHNPYNWQLAAGCRSSVTLTRNDPFTILKKFHEKEHDWLFGHMGYNLIDNVPPTSLNDKFADGFFFVPEILIRYSGDRLSIDSFNLEPEIIYKVITEEKYTAGCKISASNILSRSTREEYLQKIIAIKENIRRGDCYELNFCQEFYAENFIADPLLIFKRLTSVSPNPLTAFYRIENNYCICASPERFLKKTGLQLYSQPIKGTVKRDNDPDIDIKNRDYLANSSKEKSENVMVVDLVRNDLSKVCTEGSVKVTELFGIYSFPHVYQMISTVTGELDPAKHFTEAIEALFPMGSMTGAPKKRVMELISLYEGQERGLFSGSIGYITPDGDFDFNVVIRSIFYNENSRRISFLAGGGITFNSVPELEYEESLIKAEAIRKVLSEN